MYRLPAVLFACVCLYGCSKPAAVKSIPPTVTESVSSAVAKSTSSAVVESTSSAVAESTSSAVVESTSSAVAESTSSAVAESTASVVTEKKPPTVADDVLEFASFVVDTIIRPNFREYGLSSNLGIASISCAIPQYGYADNEIQKATIERHLIFLNDEAAQFITVSAEGGMQSDSGESYPAITKFLAQNQRVCLVSAGAKGFLKSPEDAIQIEDYSNMVPYNGPDVTVADIVGIKTDDLIFTEMNPTKLERYKEIINRQKK